MTRSLCCLDSRLIRLVLASVFFGTLPTDVSLAAQNAALIRVEPERILARLSRDEMELGQALELEIDVIGQGAVDCELNALPDISGVVIEPLSGPDLRTSERGPTARYVLSIRAIEAGHYKIDGITVTVRSDLKLAVPPVEFTATASNVAPSFTLRVNPSTRRAFTYQRVDLDLELTIPEGTEIATSGAGSLRLPWLPRVTQLPIHTRVVAGQVGLEIETHGGKLLLSRLDSAPTGGLRFATRLALVVPKPTTLEFGGATIGLAVHSTGDSSEPRSFTATAPSSLVEFVALPPQAPPEFVDLVGRFDVSAAANVPEVGLAEIVKFTVTIADRVGSSSNIEVAHGAGLESVPGFRIGSRAELRSESRLDIVLDLVPLRADLEVIPALRIAWFDPTNAQYVVEETPEIPLSILDASGGAGRDKGTQDGRGMVLIAAGVLIIVAIAKRNKRRISAPEKPLIHRPPQRELPEGHEIAQRLRESSDVTSIETAREFSRWLAVRMRCAPYACFGRGVKDRLLGHGVDEQLAERVACYFDEVEALSFGAISGIARFAAIEQLRALIDELEPLSFVPQRKRVGRGDDGP